MNIILLYNIWRIDLSLTTANLRIVANITRDISCLVADQPHGYSIYCPFSGVEWDQCIASSLNSLNYSTMCSKIPYRMSSQRTCVFVPVTSLPPEILTMGTIEQLMSRPSLVIISCLKGERMLLTSIWVLALGGEEVESFTDCQWLNCDNKVHSDQMDRRRGWYLSRRRNCPKLPH